jgi:c(7)-type cytochrome triheme protein
LTSLLLIVGSITLCVFACGSSGNPPAPEKESPAVTPRPVPDSAEAQAGDYSRFSHSEPAHTRLPCLLCHRREGTSATPVRSVGHTPCAGCHAPQFAASSGPLCAICHVNVEGGNRAIKPFPAMRSFNMVFPHSQHRSVGCSSCHKPERRGVALSIPSGIQAHNTCFKCHSPQAQSGGRDISSCGTCHQAGSYTRSPEWTRAYRVNFSHAKHNAGEGLNCLGCHTVRAGLANEVSAPSPTEHTSTRGMNCRTCHNGKRAFGEEFTSCRRCHQGPTFRF